MKTRHILKIPAGVCFLIPPAIFTAYLAVKGITPTELGMLILGIMGGLMGVLYMVFVAKPENKTQYLCATIGLVMVCLSTMALILGLVLVVTPLSFEGGRVLWKMSKTKKQ